MLFHTDSQSNSDKPRYVNDILYDKTKCYIGLETTFPVLYFTCSMSVYSVLNC